MNTTFELKKILSITGLILMGLSIGWLLFGRAPVQQSTLSDHIDQVHTDEEGNIIYTCSMHPNIRENEPGNCPICGMELISITQDDPHSDSPYELTMSEAASILAEIQTTTVVKDIAVFKHRLPGKIMVDERRIKTLSANVPGRIEELYVNFTGDYINIGDPFASIYSPQLISAQKELLEVVRYKETNPSLYNAARNKLMNWEITQVQINNMESSRKVINNVDITSKVNGYVIGKMVEVGTHIQEGESMFNVADLSKVWVVFDAFESTMETIKIGDKVSFNVKALPGKEFSADITYVDPLVNPESRTVSVRAEIENNNLRLKPNMLVQGVIDSKIRDSGEQLLIPKTAVLWTGERSVVYVKKPNTTQPTFEFREVSLGQRIGDLYIVKSGISEGEEVVTHGAFKIDGAAQLAGKASMMNRKSIEGTARLSHEHHSTEDKSIGSSGMSISSMTDSKRGDEGSKYYTPKQFRTQVEKLVLSYIDFKNALVNSEPELASEEVNRMQSDLNNVDMSLVKGQDHMVWMTQLDTLQTTLDLLIDTKDLNSQREGFLTLSNIIISIVKTFQIEGVYYQQYCPMANNGDNAYWLSEKETINNPYFGEQMLTCGETIERIDNK